MKLQDIGSSAATASKYVATRSVMNPMLWLTVIVTPLSLAVSVFSGGLLKEVTTWLAVAPPVVSMAAYLYFMFKQPDRLQSEEFILQKQWTTAKLGDNRTNDIIDISLTPSALTANTVQIESAANG